jgi:formylglycine-generating enzyme required for sulfatase activity
VEDCWHDSYVGAPQDGSAWTAGDCRKRVMRGGSWSNVPEFIRSAARSSGAADGADFDTSSYVGFRIARRLP